MRVRPTIPKTAAGPMRPPDAFAAFGFQEQEVIMMPSKKLVLVRFGATTKRDAWNTDGFIVSVIEALP